MAYKPGSMFEWDGEMFDYLIVNDEEEAEIALADGWVFHKPSKEEEAVDIKKRGRKPKQADPVAEPVESSDGEGQ